VRNSFLPISLLLLATKLFATPAEVKVLIAPRSSLIASSGKIIVDVYWINQGDCEAVIPPANSYSISYSTISRTGRRVGSFSVEATASSHQRQDRTIAPRTVRRDEITIRIEATPDDLIELTGEFSAKKATFKSNVVVLTKQRDAR
jgi:hypothetical protein